MGFIITIAASTLLIGFALGFLFASVTQARAVERVLAELAKPGNAQLTILLTRARAEVVAEVLKLAQDETRPSPDSGERCGNITRPHFPEVSFTRTVSVEPTSTPPTP